MKTLRNISFSEWASMNEVTRSYVLYEFLQDQGKEINTPPVHDLIEGINPEKFVFYCEMCQAALHLNTVVGSWQGPEKVTCPSCGDNGFFLLKTPNPSKSNESNGSP